MDEFAWQLASWLLAPVLAAVIGALAGSLKAAMAREKRHDKERDSEHAALMAGMRELMRTQLYEMHREYVVGGAPMPYDEKERADSVYEIYHALGGNGMGTHIHDELMSAYVGGRKE